jgi:hypothetical protein
MEVVDRGGPFTKVSGGVFRAWMEVDGVVAQAAHLAI